MIWLTFAAVLLAIALLIALEWDLSRGEREARRRNERND